MVSAWIAIGAFVALVHTILWMMFRRKLEGLYFPREADASFFGFFTRSRLKAITILQAAFLIAVFMLTTLFLW